MTATDKALERRILHREEPVAELPHPDELAVVVSTRAWESGDSDLVERIVQSTDGLCSSTSV